MKTKWSSVLAVPVLVVALSVALGSANGNATTFNWSITGNGISASGSLDANPSGSSYLVDAIAGTLSGQPVGLLSVGAYTNNNLVYPAGPQFLDFDGLGFSVNGSLYDVYYDPSATGTYSCGVVGYCLLGPGNPSNPSGFSDPTQVVDFSLTAATPLPAALPLFATGLGGLGLLGWHRKRKAQAV
jgi:hypothetical protein